MIPCVCATGAILYLYMLDVGLSGTRSIFEASLLAQFVTIHNSMRLLTLTFVLL